jgi:predicted nucleic-acid-binding protein
MIFVDTNYFLRFLLNDVNQQHRKAKELFTQAALGKVKLFTSMVVFFEIYWVLSSFYGKKKREIVKILKDVLKMEFINWENIGFLKKAIIIFSRQNVELEDAYNVVYAKKNGAKKVKSFDKKFQRVFGMGLV